MFLLDTNILSELIKKRPNPYLVKRLGGHPPETLFTSVICTMELKMGSALRDDFEVFWEKIEDEILSRVKILPIGPEESYIAGDILADLKRSGRWIGVEDVLISATALTHRLTAVTGNVAHFDRIRGLKVENWMLPNLS